MLISKFQPVGDAAYELREIVPDLVQSQAVAILHNAEDSGPQITGAWLVTSTDLSWKIEIQPYL